MSGKQTGTMTTPGEASQGTAKPGAEPITKPVSGKAAAKPADSRLSGQIKLIVSSLC